MQDFKLLNADDQQRLESAREWVKGHFTDDPNEKYADIGNKLRVIDVILENGWVTAEQTWQLQALGVTLGDALAQELQLDWVAVDDEFGRDPALNLPGTSLLLHPLTMISKRVEAGEAVDVVDLFEGVIQRVTEIANEARLD